MKHVHFDETKIAAANAEFCARLASRIERSGFDGAEARLKHDVMPAFYLAFAREISRGTMPTDIMDAVASAATHLILSVATSFAPPDADLDENEARELRAGACSYMSRQCAEFLAQTLDEPNVGVMHSVKPEQAGTA